jgi:hypothetical protein
MTDGPSVWQVRWDIASTWALVRFVRPFGERELRPEVHLFLADRYGRLAQHHRRAGRVGRALALERKAQEHLRLGGGDLPPAVAMAMAVPRPVAQVSAISRFKDGPDDAA